MYKSGYVLAVLANGNVVEEDSSKRICLPFGTEFKTRLINKNYEKCAADLYINGEHISRFIVNAGDTVDIERYLDGNLNSGRRFKFVSLNDSQVKDKKDIDNGIIECHFYKERKKVDPIIIREEHHHHHHDVPYYPHDPYQPKRWPPIDPYPWKYCDNTVYNNSDVSFKGMSANCHAMSFGGIATGAEGATVRGSESKQEFKEVSGLEFESTATIIKLKVVNGEPSVASRYCDSCGRKRRDGEKFCPSCGNKLI